MKKRWIRAAAMLLALVMAAAMFSACGAQEGKPEEKQTQAPANGFAEEDGVKYFYRDGEKMKNAVVGDEQTGYWYADESGAIDPGYCDGVNADGADWIVIEGAAYQVQTDSDQCLFKAAQDVAACTEPGMTREEKLKACFDYVKEHYLEGVLHDPPYSYTNIDWPIVCANDLFVYGKGDCYSYGAAFAYIARAIGFTETYACNSGGHGWAEVDEKTYDPEWSMHSNNYSYFGMRYDEECDVPYAAVISDGADYKRLKIDVHA